MGILDKPEPSMELKQFQTSLDMQEIVQRMLANIVQGYTQGFNLLWNNDKELTPQQVLDSMKGNAVQLLTCAETIKGAVNQLVPNSIVLTAPYEVTLNADGTATVVIP